MNVKRWRKINTIVSIIDEMQMRPQSLTTIWFYFFEMCLFLTQILKFKFVLFHLNRLPFFFYCIEFEFRISHQFGWCLLIEYSVFVCCINDLLRSLWIRRTDQKYKNILYTDAITLNELFNNNSITEWSNSQCLYEYRDTFYVW